MAKTTKLTEEEITTLSEIEKKFGLIKEEFGNIYIQKLNLKSRKARAENFYAELLKFEQETAKTLQDKYGKGTVNTETGEFNSLA
jgi:hypothetical protein